MTTKTSKLDFFQQKLSGQANQLRDHLLFVEDAVVSLSRKDKAAVLEFFARMDTIQQLFQMLGDDQGPNLSPESLRFDTVQRRLMAQASALLMRLGGSAGLRQVRPVEADHETQPWWFIDGYVAEQQSHQRKQIGRVVVVVAAIILVIYILLNTIFKPDPIVVARANYLDQAMVALTQEQDLQQALASAEQILAILPDDVEGLVLKGVILEKLDRSAEAEESFKRAAEVAPAPEQVPFARGRLAIQLGDSQQALDLAKQSIDINPSFAEGWFLAGQAYDQLGDFQQALSSMNTAADLALEQDNPSLYAIIKVNIGYLAPQAPTPEATTESN